MSRYKHPWEFSALFETLGKKTFPKKFVFSWKQQIYETCWNLWNLRLRPTFDEKHFECEQECFRYLVLVQKCACARVCVVKKVTPREHLGGWIGVSKYEEEFLQILGSSPDELVCERECVWKSVYV